MRTAAHARRALAVTLGAAALAGGADVAASTELRVALLVPAGGPFADHSALIARGAAIAAAEGADAAASRVRVRILPVRIRASGAPEPVTAALRAARATAVILPCNTDAVPSLARAASRAGLLSVAPCNPEPRALRSVPRTWPVGVAGPQQAAQLATFARANNGTTAFVLSARGPRYLAALADDLEAAARRAGIRVVGRAEVALDGSNANAVAARIRSSRARGILTPIYAPHLTGIVSSLRSRGVRSIVYVTDGLDALAATDLRGVRRARSPLEDVVFVTQGFARPEAASFLREYRRRHPAAVDSSLPGLGYETVRVLRAAAGRARSVRPAALDNVFRAGFSVPGVALGDITYPGRGARAPVRTVGVARVVRSEYVPLLASVPSPAAVPPG